MRSTPTLTVALELVLRAEVIAAARMADVETINEQRGLYRHTDESILGSVIDKLGIEWAFTNEALALMAQKYRSEERHRERIREHNRRIWAAEAYEENA